jgi:hypothetical protein
MRELYCCFYDSLLLQRLFKRQFGFGTSRSFRPIYDTLCLLLDAGADPTLCDHDGMTLFMKIVIFALQSFPSDSSIRSIDCQCAIAIDHVVSVIMTRHRC